jgi:phosphodiesterase/alkaline phosphatase D-like protein
MSRAIELHLTTVFSVLVIGLLMLQPRASVAGEVSNPSQDKISPTVESAADTFAFISWTTRNPRGTALHYAIVHYGTDPHHLDLTAVSPTRINPAHSDMVFRVSMEDLEPDTTYYYTVSSTQAEGTPDPGISAVQQFKTQAAR